MVVFDEALYERKLAFISKNCLDVEACKYCFYWDKERGCAHPKHPGGKVLKKAKK